jgi:hypothetical protein
VIIMLPRSMLMEKVSNCRPTFRAHWFCLFIERFAFSRLDSGKSLAEARCSRFIQGRRMTHNMWPQRWRAIQRASALKSGSFLPLIYAADKLIVRERLNLPGA